MDDPRIGTYDCPLAAEMLCDHGTCPACDEATDEYNRHCGIWEAQTNAHAFWALIRLTDAPPMDETAASWFWHDDAFWAAFPDHVPF